jgi:hypothetical protein
MHLLPQAEEMDTLGTLLLLSCRERGASKADTSSGLVGSARYLRGPLRVISCIEINILLVDTCSV